MMEPPQSRVMFGQKGSVAPRRLEPACGVMGGLVMSEMFCIEAFIPGYLIWLFIRAVGFREEFRLW